MDVVDENMGYRMLTIGPGHHFLFPAGIPEDINFGELRPFLIQQLLRAGAVSANWGRIYFNVGHGCVNQLPIMLKYAPAY